MNKPLFFIVVCFTVTIPALAGGKIPRMPMSARYEDSANYRWLNKKVRKSRLLDDMEDITGWSIENKVDDKGEGRMALTEERSKDGSHSLRVHLKTRSDEFLGIRGRPFGVTKVARRFAGEDWSDYNRISFWVYPTFPGHRIVSWMLYLENDGKQPGNPLNEVYPLTTTFVLLDNNTWNRHIKRDKVTAFGFMHRLQGNEPQASSDVSFDIDKLQLQRVDADYFEGWGVWPGRIAFSHTGYQTGAPKAAIAGDLTARNFELICQDTGRTILSKPVETVKTHIGQFQVMDFSEVTEPGGYVIQAGDIVTRPFRIDDNVWKGTIFKAINFFYCERCGTEIPGSHRTCHRDWQMVHGDKRININGGWHDAGDLCQVTTRTCGAVYAMFTLAGSLRATAQHPNLCERLIEEAKWGLDWVFKTSFRNGYRVGFAMMGIWTNGIIGDADDVPTEAVNNPYENFHTAAAEAVAARVLKETDPDLAAHCLEMAKEDWKFAAAALEQAEKNYDNSLDVASLGIIASLDLLRITGDRRYADKALQLAQIVLDCQQKSFLPGLDVPLTGFFYETVQKDRIRHQDTIEFRDNEHTPIVAMARLCHAFPEHEDWIKWYSVVALHSQFFQKEMSRFTYPYRVLPFSIYTDDEHLHLPDAWKDAFQQQVTRDIFHQQVLNGIKVGDHYYVRVFPVEPGSFARGHFPAVLSQTKALSTAAHLRRDLELAGLCQEQLYWIIGRNPFAQSTMYGEGYDYRPQYAAMSGDMVGSLPIGFKTRDNFDVPYWPASNCFHFTEMFVLPVYHWLWLMGELAGPAVVEGRVKPENVEAVRFREMQTGKTTHIEPDYISGRFRTMLPEGKYEVSTNGQRKTITLLPAETYKLDLRGDNAPDFTISHKTSPDGQVVIEITTRGSGAHSFTIRAENLTVVGPERRITLESEAAQTITWQCKMKSVDTPWVAVIVPDGDLSQRKEAVGSAWGG
jgi:hypothetical protein